MPRARIPGRCRRGPKRRFPPRRDTLRGAGFAGALLMPRPAGIAGRYASGFSMPNVSRQSFCAASLLALAWLAATLCLTAGFGYQAGAQERRVPDSLTQLQLSYAPIVQRVAPAVVNVYATHIVENQNPFLSDPFFRQFFGGGAPSKQVERSLGSGVIIDPAGLVVTNNHVIEGASEVKVAL